MTVNSENVKLFTEKAGLVSAIVSEVSSLDEAFQYTIDLCGKKEACKLLVSGCEEGLSAKAGALCETKTGKTIAAPALNKKQFSSLGKLCSENGFDLLKDGLRKYLGGIDIGFTVVDHGIAETGTLVLKSRSEELRIATMISEVHVAVLPKSKIVGTSYELESFLEECMRAADYTAFITGASRTADIERVLAIGVHGPLELHILLLEDK
ncbi:L-lactate dehydrogenase complex protein LldG [Maridesulfovibrio ferrireducens]|uniref:L-lactate dehydrogenase complex protein LldG n=1 Tax=Maridesulfovibrio ferrireducens TaxID=246191 RepID=A0A1G9H8G5_9BACT|nr:lactate utilization protein [Maridesulfovibrio ferrireducens]SDL09246.1 L-lactate dehydrogenase complex protein LldG [Maridesulfovibrio ferrireducens]